MPAIDPRIVEFLTLLAQGLLVIALPILIAAGVQAIRVQSRRLGQERLDTILAAVRMAVAVAERAGLVDKLTGPEKRAEALRIADSFLQKRGIRLDLEELVNLIEAEVILQFRNPQPPEDTAENRQALIQKAIETAVLAAEQAGLAGLIENIGQRKKAHAMSVVAQYLGDAGVSMPAELASNLIEAQLLRFKLAASGRLPAAHGPTRPPAR